MTNDEPALEYRFGAFVLQPAARRLLRGGEAVACPRLVFDLLHHLVAQRARAVGRDELAAVVWRRADVSDVQIGQVVLRARRAVDDDGAAQHTIATVPGFGYHWVAAVDAVPALPPTAALPQPAAAVEPARTTAAAGVPAPVEAADAPAVSEAVAAPRRPSRRWPILAGLALAGVLLAFAFAYTRRDGDPASPTTPTTPAPPAASAAPHALLLPLRVENHPDHAWLRLGGMDLVAERLRAADIAVPATESVLAALRTAGDGPDAQAAALRAAFGGSAVVVGEATRDTDGAWTVRLVARHGEGLPIVGTATQRDAVAATAAAADALAAALGGTPGEQPSPDADADWRRARAALLAGEVDVARRILAGSRQLAAEPARLAVYLAQVDLREGRLAQADAAMGATLDTLPPGRADATRAQALITRAATRTRLGDFDAAWRDYDAALQVLPPDAGLDRARAFSGRGSSAIPAGRLDAAVADMGQARSLFAAAGDAFGTARVDANVGMLELYRARPAAALDALDAAADRLHAFGAQHEWLVVCTAQVQAESLLLRHGAAEAVATRGWNQRERSRDPDQRIDLALNRAQVQLATGRYRDAAALLADPALDAAQGAVLRARVAALRAELASRQSRWADAARLADTALADWPTQGAEREHEPLLLLALRARLALGDTAAAQPLAERPASPFALSADLVYRELARAAWAGAQGDAATQLDALRAALASAGEGGVPATLVAVADAMVPVLLARGLADEARALAGRVAAWAGEDYDAALVQVRVLHAARDARAWRTALGVAHGLRGERVLPAALEQPPE